ncbi:hypothetical protein H2248_009595 [Termitomyces sp. 'cryptogamus']|nr:hypothetical protein H2248_009595 [Termitomyces sp. 'cryptogamus']
MSVAQDKTFQAKEQGEARLIREKEQVQLVQTLDRDFEGGFGGQEDLEDRYATTSGEH